MARKIPTHCMNSRGSVKHVGDSLTVLGWWDDTGSYQVIVEEPPAGVGCTVIFLGGCDYGGGVEDVYEDVPISAVGHLINMQKSPDATWGYNEMLELKKICEEAVS